MQSLHYASWFEELCTYLHFWPYSWFQYFHYRTGCALGNLPELFLWSTFMIQMRIDQVSFLWDLSEISAFLHFCLYSSLVLFRKCRVVCAIHARYDQRVFWNCKVHHITLIECVLWSILSIVLVYYIPTMLFFLKIR